MDALPLPDIQAFILHTYWPCALRTFVLQVRNPQAARRFLGSLVNGDASTPQLATADQYQQKHTYRLNVGITHAGLKALDLPQESLNTFSAEFVGGPLAAAPRIGDTEESAPEHWQAPFAGPDVHILLFLFITDRQNTKQTIDTQAAQLRRLYSDSGACRELSVCEADSLPHNVAHFGYNDGFAQPTIEGGPPAPPPPWPGSGPAPEIKDILPTVSPGKFLLGYGDPTIDQVPVPVELCKNGSYAAFRILEQDCHGFETFLKDQAAKTDPKRSPEWIAAKLCGRWRSGAPLTLYPDADDPHDDPKSIDRYNSFDYIKTAEFSPSEDYDDKFGNLCPIGSHIRRMNPRHAKVAGDSGLTHRIVRRGLPYGPPYDKDNPDDGVARGLMGLFIGASLQNQFEFLMKHWANDGGFAGVGQLKDPILGANNPADAKFVIPVAGAKPVVLKGFSRFVKTRGSAYCFLPSVTALKYLAGLPSPPA